MSSTPYENARARERARHLAQAARNVCGSLPPAHSLSDEIATLLAAVGALAEAIDLLADVSERQALEIELAAEACAS